MAEVGITPTVRQIANNLNLYTGREGTITIIPSSINPVAEITNQGILETVWDAQTLTSTGFMPYHTIPANEFWTVHLTKATSAGDVTMTGIYARLPIPHSWNTNAKADPKQWTPYSVATETSLMLVYDSAGGKTFLHSDITSNPKRFPPGTIFGIIVDVGTSGSTKLTLYIGREIY